MSNLLSGLIASKTRILILLRLFLNPARQACVRAERELIECQAGI